MSTKEAPQTAVVYCRISSDPSGQELGVQRQEEECRKLCEERGWTVQRVVVDNDLSATSGVERPGFEELLSLTPGRVVTWHLDRLLRLSRDLERVLDNVGEVHTVAAGELDLSTPAGRAVARTITAWSQYEGEAKADRLRAKHRQRRASGGAWWNQAPYGFRFATDEKGVQLQPRVVELDPEAAPIVADAYDRMARGESYASVSRLWCDQGVMVPGRNASDPLKPPTPNYVRRLLLHPRNAALLELEDGTLGPGGWPAIIEPERWRTIVGVAGRPEYRGKGQGARLGLLSSIAVCGVEGCGQNLRLRKAPTSKSRREGVERRIYGSDCTHVSAPTDWLDEYVGREVVKHLSSPAGLLRRADSSGTPGDAVEAMGEARKLRERLDELADAYADGDIDRAMLTRASAKIRAELEPLEVRARAAMHASPLLGGAYTGPSQLLAEWKRDMSLEERRAIVRAVVERVTVLPRKRGQKMAEDFAVAEFR